MSRTSKARVLRRMWRNAGRRIAGFSVPLRGFARAAASGHVGDKMLQAQARAWMQAKGVQL